MLQLFCCYYSWCFNRYSQCWIYCTFTLVLSEVCVQCPIWLFAVVPWLHVFLVCCSHMLGIILSPFIVLSVIPQGFVLGPLHVWYIYYSHATTYLSCLLFADDMNTFRDINVAQDCNILQCEAESIQCSWDPTFLKLNIRKTKVVTKYRNNQHMHINIYDVFYSQNSHQRVSAGIPAIVRVCAYTRIQKYKCWLIV